MRYKIPRKNKITEKETAYMQDLIKGDLIIYEDENDKIEIEAFLYNETIWLPLNKIAELFEKINLLFQDIFQIFLKNKN